MRLILLILVLSSVAGLAPLAGCTSGRGDPFTDWIDRELAASPRTEESAREATLHRGPDDRGSPAPPIQDDAGPGVFVRIALERNPSIRAADERIERLSERIAQVTSLDDPMLMVSAIGEMAETAAGQVAAMTGLSQKLPFPGKLRTRGMIATQMVEQARRDRERIRLEVAGDTRRAWWALYFSARAIEVTQSNRELLERLRDVALAKFRAGSASQQDVLRASVGISKLDQELVDYGQRRVTSIAMLNRLMDRPTDAPIPEPPAVDLERVELELRTLLTEAERANPALRKLHERMEEYRERLALARLDRWPDMTVSFNYNLVDDEGLSPVANGDDQWWIGLGVNVPIWRDRRAAGEREALHGIRETLAELGDTTNRVEFRVQDALARVDSEQQQVLLFRDVIIPQARQTLDASLSGYRAGDVEFLTLVDNWQKVLDFQLMYHRILARLEASFADLQEVVGGDLERRPINHADAEVQP